MGGIRVLHVSQPVRGGVAAVVAQLAAAQVEAEWEVTVACPAAQPHELEAGALAHTAAQAGAAVAHWAARRTPGRTVPAEARALTLLLREIRPELVHLHSSKAGLAGRLAVRGRTPVLFQPHAWSFEAVSGPAAAASLRWERYAARWADRIVCVSGGERAAGLRAGIHGRYAVIPNGVDTRRFQAEPPVDRGDGGGPLVVVVGRLCRQKGQDLLLDAWPTITARHPGARLALVGDGPDQPILAARIATDPALAAVSLPGPADDPEVWYHAADLTVVPSRWEGMALVPLEAMACGRAVVTTDVAGGREALPPDYPDWGTAEAGDADSLSRAVSAALAWRAADPAGWAAIGLAASAHVTARHSARQAADAVKALCDEVCRSRLGRIG
jgi:glycosyltransferase involved in cell wall biosynthesis